MSEPEQTTPIETVTSKSWWCNECQRYHPGATARYDLGDKSYCKKGYDKKRRVFGKLKPK